MDTFLGTTFASESQGVTWPVTKEHVIEGDYVPIVLRVGNAGPDSTGCIVTLSSPGLQGTARFTCDTTFFTPAGPTMEIPPGSKSEIRKDLKVAYGGGNSIKGTRHDVVFTLNTRDAFDPTAPDIETFRLIVYQPPYQVPQIGHADPTGASGGLIATGTPKARDEQTAIQSPAAIKTVQVAFMRLTGARCSWLRALTGHSFTPPKSISACAGPVWLNATGAKRWTLRLGHRLPKGRYIVIARTVDVDGLFSGGFSFARRDAAHLSVPG